MPSLGYRSDMPAPANEVFAWHERDGAFDRLVPPWQTIDVVERDGSIRDGDRLVMKLRFGPLSATWEARHEGYVAGREFRDVAVRSPFRRWEHRHLVTPHPERPGASVLVDSIEFDLPLGPIGNALGGWAARRALRRMFRWRHERTRIDQRRNQELAVNEPLRVAISGSSGLVGSALSAALTTAGHEVVALVRHESQTGDGAVLWDPSSGRVDRAGLEGLDAVVHLAGEGIASGRWTDDRKRRILASREDGTRLLAEALASLDAPPPVLVSASAVGFYGDTGDREVDEGSASGEGFLAEVCRRWEAAADPAREAGIRVVHPRIGVVLDGNGGALATMLPAFKAGVGGPIAGGRQFFPWVSMVDLVGAIRFVIADERAEGPVNVVAPEPVRQKEFARALGRVLRRPAFAPLPAFAVRTLFGEMGEEALMAGQRVVPSRLEALGFRWEHTSLERALRFALGKL